MATYRELQQQLTKLQEQAEQQRLVELGAALASIEKTMADFEIRPDDLMVHLKASGYKSKASKRAGKAKNKLPPKYRDPKSGESWTGRGRAPLWIKAVDDAGKPRDKFLIK